MDKRLQILGGILFAALLLAAIVGSKRNALLPDHADEDTTIEAGPTSLLTSTVYLPLIAYPSAFSQNHPVWAHTSNPASHEVGLFRHTFTLDERLESAELVIFADTRYEVWVDGSWVGRGPARFSRTTQEVERNP